MLTVTLPPLLFALFACRSLGDIDALFATHHQQQQQQDGNLLPRFSPHGTATTFTYNNEQQLIQTTGPCTWSSQHVDAINAAAAAAATGIGQQQLPLVVQLDLPDWSYSRVPADIGALTAAAAAGSDAALNSSSSSSTAAVVFELGTVLTNGSLARWLLQYDAACSRLLQKATYELYPPMA
jgi:YD repeat-containing protein